MPLLKLYVSFAPRYYDLYRLFIEATPSVFSSTGTFMANWGTVTSPLKGLKAF